MTRFLTTLALVFAQALPWAGGPLFVCIEGDGKVCLDGGPQNCDCRAAEANASSNCREEHLAGTYAHHSETCRGAEFNAAPCDCEHQLWEAAPTTLAARVAVAGVDDHADAVFVVPAVLAPIATSFQTIDGFLRGPSAGAAERILSCVVLRC
jgi:hypothetical protein